MNMQEIKCFLFMEKEEQQYEEVNVELKTLLLGEMATQKQEELKKIFFSRK